MILKEYSDKINKAENLTEKLNHYDKLNYDLSLYNDEEMVIEWLPSEDTVEQILIRADNETGLLTVNYNCDNRIIGNIIDVKLYVQ